MHFADRAEHDRDDCGRKTERGFVQQQQPRRGHQCAPDRHHLLLSTRQRAGRHVQLVAHRRKQGAYVLQRTTAFFPRRAHVAAYLEILAYGHACEQPTSLGHDRDAGAAEAMRRDGGHVMAVHRERAGAGRLQARDRIDQRRLAGAVGPHDTGKLACSHGERHVPQRRRCAVAHAQVANLKHARRPDRRWPHRRAP